MIKVKGFWTCERPFECEKSTADESTDDVRLSFMEDGDNPTSAAVVYSDGTRKTHKEMVAVGTDENGCVFTEELQFDGKEES